MSEIQHITVGGLVVGGEPVLQWIGKKSRPRRVAVGPALLSLMTDYLDRYEAAVGRQLNMGDPLVCRQKTGFGVGQLSWGRPFKTPASIAKIVRERAEEAGWILRSLGAVVPLRVSQCSAEG